jgi:antitoxin MazE
MTTKVQKWGNSLAVRLPKEMTQDLGLKQGSDVAIVHSDDLISIKPILNKKILLKDLLNSIKKNNQHKSVDWGKKIGKEIW